MVAGLGDAVLKFAQFHRRIANRAGHGLAVDKQTIIEGDFVGLLGRHFDEVAQHVVVLDFQRLDAGFGAIATLQPGDQPLALAPERAQFVQFRRVPGRDETSVADIKRQLIAKRAAKTLDQFAMVAEVPERVGYAFGGDRVSFRGVENPPNIRRRPKAVPHRGQIPGAAATEHQPGQRAFDIGTTPEGIGKVVAKPFRDNEVLNHVETQRDGFNVAQGRRQLRPQKPGAGAGQGLVDNAQKTVFSRPGERHRQFQVAPGRGVDLHHLALDHLPGRHEAGHPAFLRQFQVVHQGARRRQLGP